MNLLSTLLGISPAETPVMEWHRFPDAVLPSDRLCILNWNIAKENQQTLWQQEFSTIVQQHRPHLCFLQEARVPWPEPRPLLSLKQEAITSTFGWYFIPNLIHHPQRYAAGVLTASKTPALNSAALYSPHYEPFLQTRKVALVTEYPIARQRQTLLTINVHGINFVRSHKFQAQMNQIEQAILHHTGPLILAGDFNTWRPKRMQMLQTAVQRLKLKPAQFSSDHQNNLKRFLRSDPLDHIFYRGLEPQATQVLDKMTSSDHKPMIVSFGIVSKT